MEYKYINTITLTNSKQIGCDILYNYCKELQDYDKAGTYTKIITPTLHRIESDNHLQTPEQRKRFKMYLSNDSLVKISKQIIKELNAPKLKQAEVMVNNWNEVYKLHPCEWFESIASYLARRIVSETLQPDNLISSTATPTFLLPKSEPIPEVDKIFAWEKHFKEIETRFNQATKIEYLFHNHIYAFKYPSKKYKQVSWLTDQQRLIDVQNFDNLCKTIYQDWNNPDFIINTIKHTTQKFADGWKLTIKSYPTDETIMKIWQDTMLSISKDFNLDKFNPLQKQNSIHNIKEDELLNILYHLNHNVKTLKQSNHSYAFVHVPALVNCYEAKARDRQIHILHSPVNSAGIEEIKIEQYHHHQQECNYIFKFKDKKLIEFIKTPLPTFQNPNPPTHWYEADIQKHQFNPLLKKAKSQDLTKTR